jgi:hypothetical protein
MSKIDEVCGAQGQGSDSTDEVLILFSKAPLINKGLYAFHLK